MAKVDERRGKPRICVPFHAQVRGVDGNGEPFNVDTVLDNISGDGLYVRLMQRVDQGAKLSLVVRLDSEPEATDDGARFALDGVVRRVEQKTGGACGVAVTFHQVRVV
jgi:hypothetical protein